MLDILMDSSWSFSKFHEKSSRLLYRRLRWMLRLCDLCLSLGLCPTSRCRRIRCPDFPSRSVAVQEKRSTESLDLAAGRRLIYWRKSFLYLTNSMILFFAFNGGGRHRLWYFLRRFEQNGSKWLFVCFAFCVQNVCVLIGFDLIRCTFQRTKVMQRKTALARSAVTSGVSTTVDTMWTLLNAAASGFLPGHCPGKTPNRTNCRPRWWTHFSTWMEQCLDTIRQNRGYPKNIQTFESQWYGRIQYRQLCRAWIWLNHVEDNV